MEKQPVAVTLSLPVPPKYAGKDPKWLQSWLREQKTELKREFGPPLTDWELVWQQTDQWAYTEYAWVLTFAPSG